MIDTITATVDPRTEFRGELNELRRGMPWDPYFSVLHPSKFYRAVADLRPFGLDAMLHIEQKRYGTHKIELFETGKKGMAEIHSTLERIVDIDPGSLRLGRIDLAADVRDVSLAWFREHTFVEFKQFLCAHAKIVDAEYSEMGKKVYQTVYWGKRPSCIRAYDKVAERLAHYGLWKKRETRAAKRDWLKRISHQDPGKREPLLVPEFPTAEEWLSKELPEIKSALSTALIQADLLPDDAPHENKPLRFPVVTRIENQFGGRVPESLHTLSDMRKNVLDFNPFARIRIVAGQSIPPGPFDRDVAGHYRFGIPEWCFYMFVHQNWNLMGASQMRQILNRDRNGRRYLEKMQEFLPVEADDEPRISESELYERYRNSISRQLAA